MNHLVLTRDVLSISAINDLVADDSCGAISLFVGTTRDNFKEKKVLTLEYEAYEPMAKKQMAVICEELRSRWPDIVNIAIYHRLGLVPVREASVVIAISSPHRISSIDAVAAAIEELKKRVPIWKKELYEGDESSWKENKESGCLKSFVFDERLCFVEDAHPIPSQLIQISAAEDEIHRRIQCFVEKKREEIDLNNIMDFTDTKRRSLFDASRKEMETTSESDDHLQNNDADDSSKTCARINSIVIKQEYCKGHLKVRRVENNFGPQMRPDYLNTLDKLMKSHERIEDAGPNVKLETTKTSHGHRAMPSIGNSAFLERLETIEEYLNLPINKIKELYQRLKVIEDRLLYLESISPEYRHFLFEKSQVRDTEMIQESSKDMPRLPCDRKMYSLDDIDSIIRNMEGREPESNGDDE